MTSLLDKYRVDTEEHDLEDEKEPVKKSSSLLDKYREKPSTTKSYEEQSREVSKAVHGFETTPFEYTTQMGKSIIKSLSLGKSEEYPSLKTEEGAPGTTTGMLIGEGVKFAPLFKGLQALTGLYKGSQYVKGAMGIAGAAGIGGAHEAAREAIAGEEIDPEKIAEHAAMFGAADIGINLITKIPAGVRWLNSLRPSVKAKVLSEGVIPENLPQNSYKFFEEEVVPELRTKAEADFKTASAEAEAEAQRLFENEKNSIIAEREYAQSKLDKDFQEKMDLFNQEEQYIIGETQSQNEARILANEQKFQQEVMEYQSAKEEVDRAYRQKLANTQAKHETDMYNISKSNQQVAQEYGQEMFKYEQQKRQNEIVQEAIRKRETAKTSLEGRVKKEADDLGIEVPAPYKAKTPLHEKVGKIFSDNPVPNSTFGGAKLKKTIQDMDREEYKKVKQAYDASKKANEGIEEIHTELAYDIENELNYLKKLSSPSGPTKNLIDTLGNILEDLVVRDDNGIITSYKPMNNQVLLDQVKEMRFKVDYDFAHGTPMGIFKPWIKRIQRSAEQAAETAGNMEALESNINAREAYKEWSDIYDNDYIRPFRDISNKDYSKLYKSSLDRDNFLQIERVLSQTPEGLSEVNSLKRSMVEERLDPILSGKPKPGQLESELKELYPIINKEEAQEIRQAINEAQKTPVIRAKKTKSVPEPKVPKFERVPETVALPEKPAVGKPPVKKEVELEAPKITKERPKKKVIEEPLKLPEKKVKETLSMRAAAKKMGITPTKAMKLTDSPEGIKELRESVSPELFKKIRGDGTKRMLFEGDVKREFQGDEFARVVNKGNNYYRLSEYWGEDFTKDLLDASLSLGKQKVTYDNLKKAGVAASKLKILLSLGIL